MVPLHYQCRPPTSQMMCAWTSLGSLSQLPCHCFGPRSHHLKLSRGLECLWNCINSALTSASLAHACCRKCLHSPASNLSHTCFVKPHQKELWMSIDSPSVWGSQEGFTDMLAYTTVFSKVYLPSSYLKDSTVLILLTLHQ